MGIPKFYNWFIKQSLFAPTVIESLPGRVDVFAIDMNGLIHNNAQKIFGYGTYTQEQAGLVRERGKLMYSQQELYARRYEVFRGVFQDVVGLTQTVNPQRSLILAVDGVAPQAKINQQRSRRYKAVAERKPEQIFDSNEISPGTNFMFELDKFIRDELQRIINVDQTGREMQDPYAKILPPHIVYSNHLVPGEGEHKIARYLRRMTAKGQTAVIHGADADLIMIYLMHLRDGWENIYLFRENRQNYSIQAMLDLRMLERIIKAIYPDVPAPLDDFVTILFLNGNDFLPHFSLFERIGDALTTLIGGYREFLTANPGMGITTGTNIDWKIFGNFLKYISDTYGKILLEKWGLNEDAIIKFPSLVVERCIIKKQEVIGQRSQCRRIFDVDKFPDEWYKYVFSPKTGLGIIEPTKEDKDALVHSYLEGLAWVYNYYRHGIDQLNVGWYYPYHYSPIFADISERILRETSVTWEKNPIHIFSNFVSPLVQILMILPPKSMTIIPQAIQSLYGFASPIYDLMPESFLIDPQGKMEEWQAVSILPFPDVERVENAYNLLALPTSFTDFYSPKEDYIINRNIQQTFRPPAPARGRGAPRGARGERGRGRGRGRSRGRGV